ncbi:hypothetical protein MBM_09309 [Drepanopeziza brunnea f. sp. 'multigermtubi' MB_m1]|uniref:Uncharacterized protein n=1 Tax=Marssonina brunnea f. sp. multigermtubi (strain MB_m1) TaxID=1072389 RepID=K1WV75_MARBU|nr:uncharacterized protein MBM_09309 [Drepanopeziza brunnea f. sp. 'multigermtubi' MB_m1]EKD12553.1 hypothetical protein MBM_09309 [Drepanopeziza brunnea f. sp. 'multigermtubi' MB_m1]
MRTSWELVSTGPTWGRNTDIDGGSVYYPDIISIELATAALPPKPANLQVEKEKKKNLSRTMTSIPFFSHACKLEIQRSIRTSEAKVGLEVPDLDIPVANQQISLGPPIYASSGARPALTAMAASTTSTTCEPKPLALPPGKLTEAMSTECSIRFGTCQELKRNVVIHYGEGRHNRLHVSNVSVSAEVIKS